MPEDKKTAPTINLNLPLQTYRYLQTLSRSGVHGKKPGIVARTLVQDQIKELIRQGALRMEFDPGGDVTDESDDS